MLKLDHVVIAVVDLEAAAARLLDEHGLDSVFGGEHAGLGTANRILPLGETYIELIGVTDAELARNNLFGNAILTRLEDGGGLFTWAVATDDISKRAKWIGSQVSDMARTRPDGYALHWKMTGVEGAMADRSFPFFIEWACPPEEHPGRTAVEHKTQVKEISELEIVGSKTKVRNRLGGEELPLKIVKGEPVGPRSVTIATSDGDIVLTSGGDPPNPPA